MLGQKDKHKFHFIQPQKAPAVDIKTDRGDPAAPEGMLATDDPEKSRKLNALDESAIKKPEGVEELDSDEEEEEDAEAIGSMFNVEAEDIHLALKVVLQRQFFEAVTRCAAVKFANRSDLPTLADKVDTLFKSKLMPHAGKSKAKSPEEEKSFKIAEKVFDEYDENIRAVFKFFSKKGKAASFGIEDITLEVDDLINLFKKTDLLDGERLLLEDLIAGIEKYYCPE